VKNQNNALASRLQTLQTELSDSELRRAQLEAQIRQTHNVRCLLILYYVLISFSRWRHSVARHSGGWTLARLAVIKGIVLSLSLSLSLSLCT